MSENKDYVTFQDERGSINISDEVVTVIVAAAVLDVDGVSGLYTAPGKEITELVGKKIVSKGVKLQIGDDSLVADVSVLVEPGVAIGKVGEAVQDAVANSVEASTGVKVSAVNVHICGVMAKKK